MRKAFQKNAPVSAIERFATLLNSEAGQKEIVGVLLLSGALVKFRPHPSAFKLQKGNIFLEQDRIRAVLLADQSALTIQDGKILSVGIEGLKRFIRVPVKAPLPEPQVEPPKEKIKSKKNEAELLLYKKIVDELDQNSFAVYLQKRRSQLLRYASRHDYIAEEALQDTTVSVLGLMARKAQGEENGFCRTSEYFDTWIHSIIRNKAIKITESQWKIPTVNLMSGYDDSEDGEGGINEENLIADLDPGILSYHGHEDPLAFYERHERHLEMVALLKDLSLRAKTEPRVAMLLRASVKKAGLHGEFADEIEAADYAELAKEAGIPIGTVRSKISRARQDAQQSAAALGFTEAAEARPRSVRHKDVIAATHLVPEPG